jgi:superfamily II DNA or RNA helicase
MELRNYQIEGIEKIRESMKNGNRRVILQASCGAGKTIISAEIVKCAVGKGKKVLFLVNRRDLVKQTVDKYSEYGLGNNIGIIMAGFDAELDKPIQVASLQTYGRRLNFDDIKYNRWFHDADLVIYDECHSCNARTYRKIIELYKENSYLVGVSATPMRGDGTGLGEVFDDIITCIPTQELIDMEFLVPMIYYAPSKPDLDKIKTVAGDYDKKELGKRVDIPKLIGDIYDNWARLSYDRQTIIFATNVKHSRHIRDHFQSRGVNIEHIDAHTNDDDREDIYRRFENGDIQVLTNVGIATEGSDLPFVSSIVIARPTKVLGRWLQMAGRGARPSNGKENCILLDHAGCVEMHGFIEDDIYWTLEGKKPAAKKKTIRKKEKHLMTCRECSFVFSGKKCPQCGTEVKDYGKKIAALEADLVAVGKEKKPKATMEDKKKFYQMLEYERRMRGYSPGWTAHKFKAKFNCWPKGFKGLGPIQPNDTFFNWIKYQNIKWAKSKENPRNQAA